jgi:hypothetical protein
VNDDDKLKSIGTQSSDDPAKDLLFEEHRSLLRSVVPTRLVNRSIFCGLIVLEILVASPSLRWNIAIIATGFLVSAFWHLHEIMTNRNRDQVEKLIAETYTTRLTQISKTNSVVTRPPKEPITETRITKDQTVDIWIRAYINRRHERGRNSKLELVQRVEPITWVILLLILGVGRTLIR